MRISVPLYILAVLYACAGTGPAVEITPTSLTAEVSNIASRNNNEYLVEITITNRSGETAFLTGYTIGFYAQGETLGQWIELGHRAEGGGEALGGGLVVPCEKKWKTKELIIIPIDNPHLYRNHEGDVNVRLNYKLNVMVRSSGKKRQDEGESAYWVTPGTDRWVLREGM